MEASSAPDAYYVPLNFAVAPRCMTRPGFRHFVAALIALSGLQAGIDVAWGQAVTFSARFDCGTGRLEEGYSALSPESVYSAERGYGFLPGSLPTGVDYGGEDGLRTDGCLGDAPFYFSIDVPEGNYEVTLTLGDEMAETATTVKAESRRLMVEDARAGAGEFLTRTFVVNVRTEALPDGGVVRLKDREVGAWHWDSALTLEFTGTLPAVAGLEITRTDRPVTVFLAGNSTVTDQTREPWAAWGQMLPRFFGPGVAVANHAESGEALKSFVAERRLEKIESEMRPGDYLLIQFGHNDQKTESAAYAAPYGDYQAYLTRFVETARDHGGHAVLVTPIQRRTFDVSGKIVNSHGDYPDAMRRTAETLGVPLIDLSALSAELFEALGPEGSKRAFVHYPPGVFPRQDGPLADDTHHSAYGAYELARCVVDAIRTLVPGLAGYLADDVRPFHPGKPDPPEHWGVPVSPRATVTHPDE